MISNTKKCNACEVEKEFEMFSKDKHISDGRKNKCKQCEKEIRDKKSGKKSKKNINNLFDAQNWLKENCSKFQILEFGPPTRIYDLEKNIEFTYSSFSRFKEKLQLFPNRDFGISREELGEKIKKVFIEKHGGISPFSSEEVRDKSKKTNMERYGCENIFELKEFQDKARESMIDRHGCSNAMQVTEFKEKAVQTNIDKYGSKYPYQSQEIKEKMKSSLVKNYGVEIPSRVKHFKQANIDSKIKSGNIFLINGKLTKDLATEKGVSYSHLNNIKNKFGVDVAQDFSLEDGRTSIELFIKSFLDEVSVKYLLDKKFKNLNLRPDFQLSFCKLVIECDGLYWHSDKIIDDKKYHKNKKEQYTKFGYDSLFFREDEILDKPNVVKSIIKNKLGISERIYARNTAPLFVSSKDVASQFFSKNHLMGNGSGRTYGLFLNEELAASIQVRWVSQKEGLLDISRFCTKNGVSVVGGYSKLIKHVEKIEKPKKIQTFVDLRYGSGKYLESFGFKKESEHLSFAWTDFRKTYHRMNFPGNTGYEAGLYKIWDCGQAKWVKNL